MGTNNTKQASWVAIGSLFSFSFGIISSMILSRYFDKADYGTYKQVIYVYSTLLSVFTLGLPKAFSYFLPRVELEQGRSLINKINNIFFILGLIFSILLYSSAHLIASILNNPDLASAIRLFSIVPFFMLPTMGLEGIMATYKKSLIIALYSFFTRLLMLSCVVLPVIIFNLGYKEAIIGFDLASFLSFLLALYFKYIPFKNSPKTKCSITYKEIFCFSLPLLFASLWGTLIASSDQFFISRYFGKEVFAEFSNGFMELPFIGMIVGACSTVLSPVFSKISSGSLNPQLDILPVWTNVFKKSAMLIYPLILYCFFFSDIIMVVLYGNKYENSDVYFRLRLISNFFTIIVYGPLLINIGKVKIYSNIHMFTAFLLIFLEFLSVKLFSSPYVVAGMSVFCNLGKIYCLLYVVSKYFKVKVTNLFPIKTISLIFFPSLFILTFERFLLVQFFVFNELILLLVSFILYIVTFLLYSYFSDLDYINLIRPLLKK